MPESKLKSVIGLSRNELRPLRVEHLQEGTDWLIEKKRVVWTLNGVEKIRAVLAIPEEKNASAPLCALAIPLPEPVELLVWNPRLHNTRLILCYKPGTDPTKPEHLLRVSVCSNENFVRFVHGKPMAIKARHVEADRYELAGRCPRRKGWAPE